MSDTTELRDRIASLFRQPPGRERLGDQTPGEIADAVLAALPAPVLAEPCGSLSQPTYSGEIMRCVLPLGHPRQCQSTTEYPWVSWPSPSAEADLLITAAHRLALSEALGLGTGAPWDAIRDRAAELRRLADEAQAEAYPTEISWIAEVQESDDQWMYLRADCDRAVVEQRIASMQKRFPQWKDGTPVNSRIIRKTTTYTVEPTPKEA